MSEATVIPACLEPLTRERRWLVWRREPGRGGRLTKVPYRPDRPSSHASCNDPETWCSFDAAMRTYAEGNASGIAFALLGSNIVAFDIDHCRDAATGTLNPWATQLVARCNSYAEITPSREGIRILGTGSNQKIHRKFAVADGVSVEVYRNCERFITVTGDRISPALDQLADIDAVADEVVAELDAAKSANQRKHVSSSLEPHGRELADIIKNGCGTSFGGDKSRAVWFVIHALLEQGRTIDDITTVLIDPNNGVSEHLLGRPEDPAAYAHRQIQKAISQRANPRADGDPDPDNVEIARLAALPVLHYEKERMAAAERLGFRVAMLDRFVQAERERSTADGNGLQGGAVVLPEPEPWDTSVDGAAMLDDIVAAIRRYVVLSEHAARTCACWVVHTYLVEHFLVSPRLCISSPTKGCGKTTLLDVLYRLVQRALQASNVTPAAVFRVIEMCKPCLLIDEADTFLGANDELRGILNSGHRKGGSVLRVTGDNLEVRQFATFAPCAIALIGTLPPTLADRSIPVELRRRHRNEPVESFRPDRAAHLDQLASQAARWAKDNAIAVAAADPEMPAEVTNRARDNFRVLKAIGSVAGGNWPRYIDEAAKTAQARVADEASRLELLLGDIRAVGFLGNGTEIGSANLVQRLIELEGRPWAELGRTGKPLTANGLARLLKPLAIGPENVGPEDNRIRGYKREWFVDAFERYLAREPPSELHRCTEADEITTSRNSEAHSQAEGCAVGKCENTHNDGLLCGCAVARERPPSKDEDEAGLSEYRIRQLAGWYLDRAEAQRQETGAIRQTELDEALQSVLAEQGVFSEFIAVEFERVMRAVFGN